MSLHILIGWKGGASVGGEAAYRCDPSRLSDGYHTLQVIAELDHVVSFYGVATKGFHVDQQEDQLESIA